MGGHGFSEGKRGQSGEEVPGQGVTCGLYTLPSWRILRSWWEEAEWMSKGAPGWNQSMTPKQTWGWMWPWSSGGEEETRDGFQLWDHWPAKDRPTQLEMQTRHFQCGMGGGEDTGPFLFAFSFLEVQLMQSKLHIFDVYNVMFWHMYTSEKPITTIKIVNIFIIPKCSLCDSSIPQAHVPATTDLPFFIMDEYACSRSLYKWKHTLW